MLGFLPKRAQETGYREVFAQSFRDVVELERRLKHQHHGQHINGRKRRLLVDALSLLSVVVVSVFPVNLG